MVSTGQNFTVYVGEELDIPVTLTDVTLTGSETIVAYLRRTLTNTVEGQITATITDNGPPAVVTISLTDDDTDALTANGGRVSHTFALWRTDDGSEKPYATGEVTVVDTARTGV
jgi:hypothetical protein